MAENYLQKMISTTTYSISTGIRLVVFNFSGSMLNLFSNSHALWGYLILRMENINHTHHRKFPMHNLLLWTTCSVTIDMKSDQRLSCSDICEECSKMRQNGCVADYAAFDNLWKSLRIFGNGQKLLKHLWHWLKFVGFWWKFWECRSKNHMHLTESGN